MVKLILFFSFLSVSFLFAQNLTQETYRNSKENQRKREQTYLAIKKQVTENLKLIDERLKKIETVLNFELKREKPKITTMCIPLLLVNSKNDKTTVYEERAELELEKERLEKVEFHARLKLANLTITSASKPSELGSDEVRAKALATSMDFPPIPKKFSYKKFCDQFLEKKESSNQTQKTQIK